MSDFVEQCRREWRRLGVADPLADEMAADLASDLSEAEAEGVSAEELLGSSAFDPRSFAASWAAERGVIPVPPSRGKGRHRPFVLVAFTALAGIVLLITALLLLTGEPKVSLVMRKGPHFVAPAGAAPPTTRVTTVASASAAAPIEWILLFLAVVALGFAAWLWANWGRSRPASVSV
jgi:hypothetical protein